jgi:hypothetical protein
VALVLAKGSNTVADWQELMGPEDVRKALASAPKRYVLRCPAFCGVQTRAMLASWDSRRWNLWPLVSPSSRLLASLSITKIPTNVLTGENNFLLALHTIA